MWGSAPCAKERRAPQIPMALDCCCHQVLMGFLVGMGDEAPLQLRLLPLSNFANIGELIGR